MTTKRLITLLLPLFLYCCFLHAQASDNHHHQRLTPEEFRAKQQAFITLKAKLTEEEAARFFPIYFELQDQKKRLTEQAAGLLRKGRDKASTEADYEQLLEGFYDARIASSQLEKTYFEKFKKILPCKKIYLVHRAEMRFRRQLLKELRNNDKTIDQHPGSKK